MSITTLPNGTWQLDPIHSHATFAIRHAVVNTFRGEFKHLAATLEAGDDGTASLTGTVRVDSIDVNDPALKDHLMAADFFAADAFPTITFASDTFRRTDGEVVIAGALTMKGATHRVEGKGDMADGAVDLYGNTRLGITVETSIDRTAFGIDWNAPLPKGGFALSKEVKLTLDLAFVQAAEPVESPAG